MTFLAPPWLLGLASVAVILLLYLIKSRYRREVVPSLILWRAVPRDLVARSAWRRPRRELLVWLQLLAAMAAALALAKPAITWRPAPSLVIVLDTAASMRASDVSPSRFEAAKRIARELISTERNDVSLMLVAAGPRPQLYATGHKEDIAAAVEALSIDTERSDMGTALRLAVGLARTTPGLTGQVVVITDGAFALERGVPPASAGVSFRLVGGQSEHAAITNVTLRRPVEPRRAVPGFASIVNFGSREIVAPAVIYADGVQVDSRPVSVPARGRIAVTFEVPADTRQVSLVLPVQDVLPTDLHVDVTAPAAYGRAVLLVSDQPRAWARILDAVPYVRWRSVQPAQFDQRDIMAEEIVIFDRFTPQHLPPTPTVVIGAVPESLGGEWQPLNTRAWDLDVSDDLLRGLDLTPLNVTGLVALQTPDWAQVAITDRLGRPLLIHGLLDHQRVVILPFDISASNLQHLAAFPILVSNIIDWLIPGRGDQVRAGVDLAADISPRANLATTGQSLDAADTRQIVWRDVWAGLLVLALIFVFAEWAISARLTADLLRPSLASALRVACVTCFCIALLQPTVRVPDDAMTVVFAIDRSGSISADMREAASAWVRAALQAHHQDDRVGLVTFAGDAHVLRSAAPGEIADVQAGTPDASETDIGVGLRVAASLARTNSTTRGRVVLLSDGRATTGSLSAALSAVDDVQVDVVPLPVTGSLRVAIDRFMVPAYARSGDTFEGTLLIDATQPTPAAVEVSIDGQPTMDQTVTLNTGVNRVSIAQTLVAEGSHRIDVHVVGPAGATDSGSANAAASIVVKAAPRVLVIEERRSEGTLIQATLQSAGLRVDVRGPDQLPDAAQLENFDCVVLANVSATSFTLDQQNVLRTYVEANGHGLLTLGGTTSYGLGSYADSVLEGLLPVLSNVPPSRDDARVALLLIIDTSQSMSRRSEGIASIQMAREAGVLATRALDDRDQVGVLTFNHRFRWIAEMNTVAQIGRQTLEDRISQLEPEGGTEIYNALAEGATAILGSRADLRHVVLFTDGQSRAANYEPLVGQLRQANVGLSTIGLGPEADTQLLSSLARLGQGRYYFTERLPELPRIMAREIAISKRSAQIEGIIRPQLVASSPILRSIAPNELPALSGYVATMARDEAQVVLATDDGHPLLAQWHLGLGRAVSWTSDAGPNWGRDWIQWPGGARVWEQAVRWAAGPPVQRDFQLSASALGHQAEINLDLIRNGRFVDLETPSASITDSTGRSTAVNLRQVAPGRYTARTLADAPGAYQVTGVSQSPSGARLSESSGFAIRDNPELAGFGPVDHVLRQIAVSTSGRVLSDPASAFRAEGRQASERSQSIWQLLALAGLVMFTLDVAVRRLGLSWPVKRR